jgi:hypothetical protein
MRWILLAVLVLLLVPTSASAQEFGPLTPPDGASVSVDPDGIPVNFTCPAYGLFGNPSTYGVSLSTSSALGSDGRLTDGVLVPGAADRANPGQCAVRLGAGGPPPRIQEMPGTYFWQVWRICTECPTSYETGLVRTLTLTSPVDPKLTAPAKVYAGYPFIATVAVAGAPDGSVVTVGRGSGTALGGKAEVVLTLARGTHELRPTLTIGGSPVTGAATRVTARNAKNWTTTRADGVYTGKAGSRSVKFKVTKKGRELRGFSAFVPLTCPGITPGTFTTMIATAMISRAKIAPDGSYVGVLAEEGVSIRLRGKIKGRKVTGGRVEMSEGSCVGNSAYSARR